MSNEESPMERIGSSSAAHTTSPLRKIRLLDVSLKSSESIGGFGSGFGSKARFLPSLTGEDLGRTTRAATDLVGDVFGESENGLFNGRTPNAAEISKSVAARVVRPRSS